MDQNDNNSGQSPETAPTAAVAAAVAETISDVAKTAAPASPETVSLPLSGNLFFAMCQYVGSKPYALVQNVRAGMWELQKQQNCVAANQLPETVQISIANINVLDSFLQQFPHDDVADLITAFRGEVQAAVNRLAAEAKEAEVKATSPAAAVSSVVNDAGETFAVQSAGDTVTAAAGDASTVVEG